MAKKPTSDVEADRLFAQSQHRYLRVIAHGTELIEVAPKADCRITFSDEVDGDRRRVRILVGPVRPAAKPREPR
jgi:hypothetical protein